MCELEIPESTVTPVTASMCILDSIFRYHEHHIQYSEHLCFRRSVDYIRHTCFTYHPCTLNLLSIAKLCLSIALFEEDLKSLCLNAPKPKFTKSRSKYVGEGLKLHLNEMYELYFNLCEDLLAREPDSANYIFSSIVELKTHVQFKLLCYLRCISLISAKRTMILLYSGHFLANRLTML